MQAINIGGLIRNRGLNMLAGLFTFAAVLGLIFSLARQSNQLEIQLTQGTNIAAALSPDGKNLVFDLQGTLWKMPAAGGKAAAITDELGDARQPAWSPDGRRIAFQSYRDDGNWHIRTIAADGSQLTQVTTGPFDDREPHWSPDGKRIAFASDRDGNYDIWAVELASGELEQLTRDPANDYQPAWAPDGRRIAFASERAEGRGIWLIEQVGNAGKRQEKLFSQTKATPAAPSWSAYGTQIVYQTSDRAAGTTELWAKAFGFQEQTRQLSKAGEDVFPFRAAWFSDSEFLYTADGAIKRASLQYSRPTTIAFEATIELDRPAYASRKRDFDSSTPRPVRGIVAPAVSPDGGRVTFTALGDLWIAELNKKPERVTSDVFIQAQPRWSPDGSKLIYLSDKQGEMDIWLRDLKTGEDRMLVKTPGGANSPVWSPDGTRIAYFTGTALTARLQVFDPATSQTGTIFNQPIQPTQISWGPDSRSFAVPVLKPHSTRYREGLYEVAIVAMDGSVKRRIAPVPNRTFSYAVWSPDGRKLAFVEDGRLSVVALNERGEMAGAPRRVSGDLADWPSWTGDSRSLVYQSLDRLKKVNLETGRVEEFNLQLEWQPEKVGGTMVVHAGRLFDGQSSEYRRDVDVVIEGHRIKEIVAHDQSLHTGAVIDASDKTVIPGLFEMHGHQAITVGEKLGRTWLAFGITSVRDPGSDPYDGLERREAWASGQRPGPRSFFTGRLFDGARVYYAIAEGLSSEAHLDLALERARVLEYDLIKTYVRLPDAMQKKIVTAAHQMGIPASSHEIWPAAGYGMDAVEHNGATSRRGYSPKTTALSRSYDDVIQILARSGMNYTPTLILSGLSYHLAENPSLIENRQFVSLYGEAGVQAMRARAGTGRSAALREAIAAQGKTALAVLKAGGRVTPGTDAPIVPYGFALQLELQMLVRAGFTPFEALRSATLWSAEAAGVAADLGTIERGKLADLVIVEGDPLRKIEDTLNIAVTIKNGRPYMIRDLLTAPR